MNSQSADLDQSHETLVVNRSDLLGSHNVDPKKKKILQISNCVSLLTILIMNQMASAEPNM